MEEKKMPFWKVIMMLPYLVICLLFIAEINRQDRANLRKFRKAQKQNAES